MCAIIVQKNESKIVVVSPYNPNLPARAKKLGGRWDAGSSAWAFDARLEADVEALYREIYGEWPGEATEYVTLIAEAMREVYEDRGGIFIAGRCIARAFGRDSGARLGDGVILRAGKIDSGGSVKNWKTVANSGARVEIMDVPRPMAEAALADPPDHWRLTIKEGSAAIDRAALEEEKARLLARIAEIERLLEQ